MMQKRLPFAIIAVALVTGLVITTRVAHTAPANPTQTQRPALELGTADLALVQSGAFQIRQQLMGELSAIQQTTLTAQVEGDLAEVRARPGMTVKRGEILAVFAGRDLLQKQLAQEAQLAKSREQLAFQKQQLARNKDLLAQKFISQNAFDSVASQLAVQEADVHANEAQLAMTRQNLDYAQVRAPFAGVLAERFVEPGQRVGFNTKLFTLVNLDQLELKLSVPASQIGYIQTGQKITFSVDGLAQRFEGKVIRIAPTADSNRSFPIYAQVANPKHPLRAGMFAKANLALEAASNALSVPSAAVRDEGGSTVVFVIENQRLQRRPVEAGATANGFTQIRSGLKVGDTVITTPISGLEDGRTVRLPATQ